MIEQIGEIIGAHKVIDGAPQIFIGRRIAARQHLEDRSKGVIKIGAGFETACPREPEGTWPVIPSRAF